MSGGSQSLEIIERIIKQLSPVGNMDRGTPLRSADWNTMVHSIIELARLTAVREQAVMNGLDAQYARSGHEHVGEADLSWFDETTSKLITSGSDSSPKINAAITRLDSDIEDIYGEIKQLKGEVKKLQKFMDNLRDEAGSNNGKVDRLGKDVDSMKDMGNKFNQVNRKFNELSDTVEEAIVFRDSIKSDEGEQIDIRKLHSDVEELDEMREYLKLSDGTFGRLRDIERRIEQIEGSNISDDKLDEAIKDQLGDSDIFEDERIRDKITGGLEEEFNSRINELLERSGSIEEEINDAKEEQSTYGARLESMDSRVSTTEIGVTRIPGLASDMDKVKTELVSAKTEIRAVAVKTERLNGLPGRMDSVDKQLEKVQDLDQSVATLVESVERLESKTADIPNDFTSRLSELKQSADMTRELDADVSSLSKNVQKGESSLILIGERVGLNETQIEDLAPIVSKAVSQTTRIDSQLKKLNLVNWKSSVNTAIEKLNSDVKDLKRPIRG